MAQHRNWILTAACAGLVALGACEAAAPTPAGEDVVEVLPREATLSALGDTLHLSAQILDAHGEPRPGVELTWSSTEPSVADVTADGVVTARANGSVEIVASARSARPGIVKVNVEQATSKVTIAPRSSRLRVGETVQLVATAVDANGHSVDAPELAWTSDHPEVAEVTPSGEVTAKALGTTLISATPVCCPTGNLVEPAEIVVASDGVGVGTNEPTGFTKISERWFNAKNEDGWSDLDGRTATFSIVPDPSAPTSPTAGRIELPAGYTARGSSSEMASIGRRGWDASDVYVSFTFKVSENWQGHGSGTNKVFYLTDQTSGGGGDPLFFRVHGGGSNRLHFDVNLQSPDTSIRNYEWNDSDNRVTPTFEDAEIIRGRWHRIEVLILGNTPGLADGEVHAWVDGTKILEFTNQAILSPGSDGTFDNLRWHPIWGGQHTTNVEATMHQYIDHIYLSGR